jgi:hypothetical protein
MKATVDEQRRKIDELESARQRQEGTIARQVSEIDSLNAAKNKCEDELKSTTETNEAQERERIEEVGKLKEEIRRMASPTRSQFPPSMTKGGRFDLPDGIIAHLTMKCGGNVHDHHIVDVTSGSFEKETIGANSHSGAYGNLPDNAAKNAADLETGSRFQSAYRGRSEDIPHTKNNWVCYDFKERRIVPTHCAIRTHGGRNLKSWCVGTSVDGKSWQEVAQEEDNIQLNDKWRTATFPVTGGGWCRFIRLVNIGRNHFGDDLLYISAWEIFGSLVE